MMRMTDPTPAAPEKPTGEHGDLPTTPTADEVRAHEEELLDEELDESFPASDPPAHTHTHAGPPDPVV